MKAKTLLGTMIIAIGVSVSSCSQYLTVGEYETDDVYFATNDYLIPPSPATIGSSQNEEDYYVEDRYDSLDARYAELTAPEPSSMSAIDQGCGLNRLQTGMNMGMGIGFSNYYGGGFGYQNPYNTYYGMGYGYNPYGYNPYGYNPYGYNPYNMGYGSYMGYQPYYPSVYSNFPSSGNTGSNPNYYISDKPSRNAGNAPDRSAYINALNSEDGKRDMSNTQGKRSSTPTVRPSSNSINRGRQSTSPRYNGYSQQTTNSRQQGLSTPVTRSNTSPRTKPTITRPRPTLSTPSYQTSPRNSSTTERQGSMSTPSYSSPRTSAPRTKTSSPKPSGGASPGVRRR